MPVVDVKMLKGRTPEQKRELVKKITEAVASSCAVRSEAVSVLIEEYEKGHWAEGGVLYSEKT